MNKEIITERVEPELKLRNPRDTKNSTFYTQSEQEIGVK
jgi:hypothetical protein